MEQIARLIELVAEARGCTVDDVLSTSRRSNIAETRQIAMHIAQRLTWLSYPQLARSFGKLSHATVLRADAKVSRLRHQDRKFDAAVSKIEAAIQRHLATEFSPNFINRSF